MWFRWAFLSVIVIVGLLVFYEPLAQLLPASLVDLLQRNSEAYVFAVLIIVDVEVVAPDQQRSVGPAWWLWLGFLGLAWATTYLWGDTLGLAQEVITLNEAFAAVILLSVYLRWSRGQSASRQPAVGRQLTFYGVVLALPILGELLSGGPADEVGVRLVDNAEVFGFAILVGVLFDLMERWPSGPSLRGWRRWAWYLLLLVVPVLYTAFNPPHEEIADATGFIPSSIAWLQRVTEAFVAATIISVFYDLRRLVGLPSTSARRHSWDC